MTPDAKVGPTPREALEMADRARFVERIRALEAEKAGLLRQLDETITRAEKAEADKLEMGHELEFLRARVKEPPHLYFRDQPSRPFMHSFWCWCVVWDKITLWPGAREIRYIRLSKQEAPR